MSKNSQCLTTPEPSCEVRGFKIYKELLSKGQQITMIADLRRIVHQAPLFRPVTPSGRRMSVQMTSCGMLGWISDKAGYRYEKRHPSGVPWPPIPVSVLDIWQQVSACHRTPDSCLINLYREGTRMGLHQDADEADFRYPVVSVSLGDDGLFRIGNCQRGGTTESIWLQSGDVVVMGGNARLVHHGIDRIRFGSSKLLSNGGRLNLTLRVAA